MGQKSDDLITLELTKDEVLMLQQLTEDMDCGYQWIREIAESLRKKALQAYQKPRLSPQEYQERLEDATKMWQGKPAKPFMVHAEKASIKFYYDVEEAE